MIVLDGPAGNGIGKGIAAILKSAYAGVDHKLFPDGESYIRMPSLEENEDSMAVLVQSTYPPHEKHMIELLFMIDALKEAGTKHIIAIVPYLAYARQNRMFQPREAISINTVMRLISESGAEALVTVEPHRYEVVSLFKGRAEIVDPTKAFSEALAASANKPFVMATDSGDMARAKKLSELLDCDYDYIEKERDPKTGSVSAKNMIQSDLRGRDVIIYDDVISTGGTIELASKMSLSNGARKVIAAAPHLVMAGNAYEKLVNAGVSEIYGTNTIPFQKARIIDISGSIASALASLLA